jgi:hypothetical protein
MTNQDESRRRAKPYLDLVKRFLDGGATAEEFHDSFLAAFKRDEHVYAADIGALLRDMFDDVECYEPDGGLRAELKKKDPKFTIDEAELRASAEKFASYLRPLLSP